MCYKLQGKLDMRLLLATALILSSQLAYSLDLFQTNIKLSSRLGDTYCQNIVHNDKFDWRMPSFSDLLELLSQGVVFETSYCSNTTKVTSSGLITHKCLGSTGKLYELSEDSSFDLICVRGESTFTENPSVQSCPTATFSMSSGILTIPLLNVPNMLGDIEKYHVRLKMVSDDLKFEFLDAVKIVE